VIVVFGNGQLGRELARAAALQATPMETLTHVEVDIAKSAAVASVLSRIKPTLVVNAAAYTKVDLAETHVKEAHLANEIGPAVLARACAEAQLPMIHVSTDYVFDGAKQGAYLETDSVCPINTYGRTKAAGEQAVRGILKRHVIVRTAWVYSEFGHNFLKTILRLTATRDELRIVADQRGTPTSARELAEAILRISPRLANQGLAGQEQVWGTYHFTAEGVTTWHGFASRIVAVKAPIIGRNPRVTPITTADYPQAARRPANSQLDCRLFTKVFGFSGRHWTEGVDMTTKALVVTSSQRTAHVS
jgi:dTDP-4-dehydrorhamnose reductase